MSRKKAFTLVELLVVISIMAMLLAVLLPALRKARDQAKKTICKSDIKQIYIGSMAYSQSNNDALLMGYQYGFKQYNYAIWDGGYVVWGPLYKGKYIKDQKSWHCPAYRDWYEVTDVWPPEALIDGRIKRADVFNFSAVSTYGARPDINWIINTRTNEWQPTKTVKLTGLSSSIPYMSDWCSDEYVMSKGHKIGVNIGYLDGYTRWLSSSEKKMIKSARREFSLKEMLKMMRGAWGVNYNDDMERIWELFAYR